MPLNDLSLEELTELGKTIALLVVTGGQFQRSGFTPTFDLTPGAPTKIILPPMMPKDANWQVPEYAQDETTEPLAEALARFDQNDAEIYADHERTKRRLRDLEQCVADLSAMAEANGLHLLPIPSTEAAPDAPGAVATDAPELVDPPPAVEGPAGGTLSAEPSRTGGEADPPPAATEASPPPLAKAPPPVAEAESGGGQAVAAAQSPAATHERTFTRGPDWTAEEDARLIEIIVQSVGMGATKKAGMIAAAKELGRPEAATQFRCHHKLKARIDAALTAAAMAQAQTEIPETRSPEAARQDDSPAAEPLAEASVPHGGEPLASEPEPGAKGHDTPAAAIEGQLAEARPEEVAPSDLHGLDLRLWQYLRRNRPRWPLTIGTDLDLVEALGRGDKLPMIAADLGIDAGKLKDRFQVLTAMILDARDRPTIDGLQRLVKMLRRIVADATPTKAA